MTQQDPDIAALTARLGLRGMHYRSFGNRPVAAAPTAEPPPAAPVEAMTPPQATTAAPPWPVEAATPLPATVS
ncbi:hypothetical protein, partial [Roseomonas rosulenta]|uniref:hypothetical protein n=1 Tax=Roseomonas rosulenta TaxID=2748667 RepID=UPI0038D16164